MLHCIILQYQDKYKSCQHNELYLAYTVRCVAIEYEIIFLLIWLYTHVCVCVSCVCVCVTVNLPPLFTMFRVT